MERIIEMDAVTSTDDLEYVKYRSSSWYNLSTEERYLFIKAIKTHPYGPTTKGLIDGSTSGQFSLWIYSAKRKDPNAQVCKIVNVISYNTYPNEQMDFFILTLAGVNTKNHWERYLSEVYNTARLLGFASVSAYMEPERHKKLIRLGLNDNGWANPRYYVLTRDIKTQSKKD